MKQKRHEFLDKTDGEWKKVLENKEIESEELVFINPLLEAIRTKRTSVDDIIVNNTLDTEKVVTKDLDFATADIKQIHTAESNGNLRCKLLIQHDGENKSDFAFADEVSSETCAADKSVIVPTRDIFINASTINIGKQSNNEIPKIIHMNWGLWDSGELPEEPTELLREWQREFPEHKFIIWDKEKSENFIRNEFPIWFPIWKSCKRKVMLSDLLRTLVVYRFGGMYRDIDLRNHGCKEVWSKKGVVLFTETLIDEALSLKIGKQEKIRSGKPEELIRVANYAFASAPFEPFLYFILHEMRQRWELQDTFHGDYDILYITGPALWSSIYDRHKSCAELISLEKSHEMIEHLAFGTWRSSQDVSS